VYSIQFSRHASGSTAWIRVGVRVRVSITSRLVDMLCDDLEVVNGCLRLYILVMCIACIGDLFVIILFCTVLCSFAVPGRKRIQQSK